MTHKAVQGRIVERELGIGMAARAQIGEGVCPEVLGPRPLLFIEPLETGIMDGAQQRVLIAEMPVESGRGTANRLGDRRQRHIEIVPLAKEPDGLLDCFPGNIEGRIFLRAGHQCRPRLDLTLPNARSLIAEHGVIALAGTLAALLLAGCWRALYLMTFIFR